MRAERGRGPSRNEKRGISERGSHKEKLSEGWARRSRRGKREEESHWGSIGGSLPEVFAGDKWKKKSDEKRKEGDE